jgi:hypothetical protein
MKTSTILTLAIASLLCMGGKVARATIYTFAGTFSYTFTDLWQRADDSKPWTVTASVPGLSVGDTFSGIYGYESESIDGAFGATAPDFLAYSSFYAYGVGQLGPFPSLDFPYSYNGYIVVDGGQVIAANANHQAGPWLVHASLDSFAFLDNNAGGYYEGFGAIQWSGPRKVPDTGATLVLLTLSLAIVAPMRRRLTV